MGPRGRARAGPEKGVFDIPRINEIEKKVKHDVIAFLTSVAEHIGDDSRFLHVGMTSSDVLDTAFAVQMRQALTLLIHEADAVFEVLKARALEHRGTVMIGRTHGIHAEPVTFGWKMALWADEMHRDIARLVRARDVISVGKISGAVGTFANIDPFVEEYVCRKLRLSPAPASTQVIQRDRHAEVFATLAIVASSLDEVLHGNPALAADGGARGGGVLLRGPERLFRHASQAESRSLGKPLRPLAAATRLMRHGDGEHGALA